MLPEVGGQIGNTDAVVIVSLALPERPCRRIMARDPQSGALQLVAGRGWDGEEYKGLGGWVAIPDRRNQMRALGIPIAPVAMLHLCIETMALDTRQVRPQRQYLVVRGEGFVVALERGEDIAAIAVRFRIVRL